ncbi:MAG: alkaline phosphatase [Granulosicoccus sp.]
MLQGERGILFKLLTVVMAVIAASSSGGLFAQSIPDSQRQNPWFRDGVNHINSRLDSQRRQAGASPAKNVILFIGDGMGVSTLSAARILSGQRLGASGEEASLSFERFAHTALVKTYNLDAQIPDSSGTMTAMMSGVKTNTGVLGVNASVRLGNCLQVGGNELASALDLAEMKGLATGIVSTARITHATPAAAYAKSANRAWEDISDQPASVIEQGCEDIALQLVNFEQNLEQREPELDVDGIDVVLGGGRRHFLPANPDTDLISSYGQGSGDRTDERNLVEEWVQRYPDGRYVFDGAGLAALDTATTDRLFGLFSSSHMQYEAARVQSEGAQPSLSQMVVKAVEVLRKKPEGFLLIVESGRIDHAHHAGNAFGALSDTLALSTAVEAALSLTDTTDTLIMVTADHSHVLTFSGYPRRGNPILGKVVSAGDVLPALASDGLPYTTLGYANGRGFRDYGPNPDPDRSYSDPVVGGRQNLTNIDTEASGFHQEVLVPLVSESHAGEDVSLHATGAGAFRVQGTIEQNLIFHIIDQAAGLTQ